MSVQPSSPIYRLMYMSSTLRDMSDADLEAVLATARTFNPTRNITGLLLYVERQFLQYLEGEESAVEELYARIERDPRHSGVLRLFSGPYPRRIFEGWSMGFQHIDQTQRQTIEGAVDLCQQSLLAAIPTGAPKEITVFMESFYRNNVGMRDYVSI